MLVELAKATELLRLVGDFPPAPYRLPEVTRVSRFDKHGHEENHKVNQSKKESEINLTN